MSNNEIVYLDNAATTRTDREVLDSMTPYFNDEYGNPATMYSLGQSASKAIEHAREQVAALVGADCPSEIYFTAGGTESDNWALCSSIMCSDKKHVITSALEHHAVLETCEFLETIGCGGKADFLKVDEYGFVSADALKESIREDTGIISIMHANNEIGTLEPVEELSRAAKEKGVLFHTDAVQTAGKIPLDVNKLGVDMLSISGHKFHGPKGVGALYVRKGTRIKPFIHGGGQENSKRAGTSNVPGIVGMGAAAENAAAGIPDKAAKMKKLTTMLWEGLNNNINAIRRNGHPEKCIPGTLNITVTGIEGEAMLLMLDMQGICVSSGSACTTGSLDPSHVLLAIGLPAEIAHGSLRFSLSKYTTKDDIKKVIEVLPPIVERLREMSPTWKE
ncbi:MAG: cysteine desulfurase NifS [Planctomycetota bacterium]|jgi:cysteine desulfurase